MSARGNGHALYCIGTGQALVIRRGEHYPYALADGLAAAALFRHAQPVQRSVPALYAAVWAHLAEVVQPFHLIKAVVFNKGAVMHHVHIKRRIIGNGMVNLAHLLQLAAHEHNKVNVALLAFGIRGTERVRPAV